MTNSRKNFKTSLLAKIEESAACTLPNSLLEVICVSFVQRKAYEAMLYVPYFLCLISLSSLIFQVKNKNEGEKVQSEVYGFVRVTIHAKSVLHGLKQEYVIRRKNLLE